MFHWHNAVEGTTPRGSRLSTEGRQGGPFPYDDVMQVPEASQAQQAGPAFSSQPTIREEHRDGYADSQGVLLHYTVYLVTRTAGVTRVIAECNMPSGLQGPRCVLLL